MAVTARQRGPMAFRADHRADFLARSVDGFLPPSGAFILGKQLAFARFALAVCPAPADGRCVFLDRPPARKAYPSAARDRRNRHPGRGLRNPPILRMGSLAAGESV